MICRRCHQVFNPEEAPGGLLFGVPRLAVVDGECREESEKIHLCHLCTHDLIYDIKYGHEGNDIEHVD